jgi:hypothetical protein
MGKGTEYEKARAARWAEGRADHETSSEPRPALRLRPDVLADAIDPRTVDSELLDRVTGKRAGKLTVIRDTESGATVVVVPVEQYFTLVTSHIRDQGLATMRTDGRVGPFDETLTELGVEQVNPHDTWLPVPGYDPTHPGTD